jgi:hypothetical protein
MAVHVISTSALPALAQTTCSQAKQWAHWVELLGELVRCDLFRKDHDVQLAGALLLHSAHACIALRDALHKPIQGRTVADLRTLLHVHSASAAGFCSQHGPE